MPRTTGASLVLQMLKAYGVRHVFGFPGETTIPLYVEWHRFPEISHVLARDERGASFMADAYSRAAFGPGVCEAPSVGATHLIPGVAEAFKASVAMIALTTDIPLDQERRNMLTGVDQTMLFRGITKESMTVTRASEIPSVMQRAFRLATTGRPGPVHVRLPVDTLTQEIDSPDVAAQPAFASTPGQRPTADEDAIREALELLLHIQGPLIICGQGVLYSQAWAEVAELAGALSIPVATSMTGKGSIAESHPLAVGVVGCRGGTSFSNGVLEDADLLFYIGSDTDSALTGGGTMPRPGTKKIIHLDISEDEAGNNYPEAVPLIGDARATLRRMLQVLRAAPPTDRSDAASRAASVAAERDHFRASLHPGAETDGRLVDPLHFVRELSDRIPDDHLIVCDPGVSAIYTSAFFPVRRAGRDFIFNYAMGALGYAIPASVGAHMARPEACVVALTGDGSFGLTAGELETVGRAGGNTKIILFNNGCFGWMKAAFRFGHTPEYFATELRSIDYVKIAQGFGLEAYRVENPQDLGPTLNRAFSTAGPVFVELPVGSESDLVPPVPQWAKKARELGLPLVY